MKSRVKPNDEFGLLTVKKFSHRRKGHVYWLVKCKCGNTKEVSSTNLLNNSVKSCGCMSSKWISASLTKHGMKETGTYKSWSEMKRRCHGPSSNKYKNYGGRGIKVCERWRQSFDAFLTDMGPRPGQEYSIDRKDNNGDYCPENCRWATKKQQNNNRRDTILLTVDEQIKPLSEWADIYKINRVLLWLRIYRLKWSVEDAVKTPVNGRSHRHGGKLA